MDQLADQTLKGASFSGGLLSIYVGTNTDKPFTFRLATREKAAPFGPGLPRTGGLNVIFFFLKDVARWAGRVWT